MATMKFRRTTNSTLDPEGSEDDSGLGKHRQEGQFPDSATGEFFDVGSRELLGRWHFHRVQGCCEDLRLRSSRSRGFQRHAL